MGCKPIFLNLWRPTTVGYPAPRAQDCGCVGLVLRRVDHPQPAPPGRAGCGTRPRNASRRTRARTRAPMRRWKMSQHGISFERTVLDLSQSGINGAQHYRTARASSSSRKAVGRNPRSRADHCASRRCHKTPSQMIASPISDSANGKSRLSRKTCWERCPR